MRLTININRTIPRRIFRVFTFGEWVACERILFGWWDFNCRWFSIFSAHDKGEWFYFSLNEYKTGFNCIRAKVNLLNSSITIVIFLINKNKSQSREGSIECFVTLSFYSNFRRRLFRWAIDKHSFRSRFSTQRLSWANLISASTCICHLENTCNIF